MVFKKFMAKLGKGSAQVDLVLDKQEYKLGEQINGELFIQGGTIEQDINKIDIDFLMSVRIGEHEQTILINRFPFHEPFKIKPSERKSYSFSYELPQNLLLSGYSVSYYFITHLDIAAGVDSTDRDPIDVLPPDRFQNILKAFDKLGFCEKYGSRSFDGHMQEFELTPTSLLKDDVKEVEFVAAMEKAGIHLLLEVDLRTFSGEKEVKREVWLDNELLNNESELVNHLQHILFEMVNEPGFYHYDKAKFHHKVSRLPGAIGAFAIGLIAMELLDEAVEEVAEGIFGEEEQEGLFDFFGGEEEED
ncbi:sporulation protein [Laceyella putida]|uniref:Sporulation protein n=1 Tax=Laceyella putida TaxID=110101 RepID=A0ABW2RH69_9BACL